MSSDNSNLDSFIEILLRLPPVPGVSFRGWIHPADLGAVDVATRLITAASVDMAIATAGFSTSDLAVMVGRTGRDIGAFSGMPKLRKSRTHRAGYAEAIQSRRSTIST